MGTIRSIRVIVLLIYVMMMLHAEGNNVDITYVESAVSKGAVCLDGSPPAYHFSPGFGTGVDKWLVNLQGGAWCNNVASCLARRDTFLGSSKAMDKQMPFLGILSNEQEFNPDFFNWNKVYVLYCDGSSFTGDAEAVDPATKLYYRGARVFTAVVDDLKAKGMCHASYALLAGCSAGGLASIINCDKFSSLMPSTTKVKCLADAGYFINVKDISGGQHIQEYYSDVVKTHESTMNLPTYCTSKMSPELCFFPENIAQQIQTPLFLLNAAYDTWRIQSILAPDVADPHGSWHSCKCDIKQCSSQQLDTIQGFRQNFLAALSKGGTASSRGFFINSCFTHCQTGMETWMADGSPILNETSIAKAIGDWYFDRNPFQTIDCPYPCDSSCLNSVFKD